VNVITHLKKRTKMASSTRLARTSPLADNSQTSTNSRWYRIKHWFQLRPCWGVFCVLFASILMLWGPLFLLQSPIIPPSSLWAGLVVGGLLFAMGLIELFAPSYALVAGAIGVVLSLVSLITVLGGFGLGMLLGIIGSSYAVAWKPERKIGSRLVFWSVFGCSMAVVVGIMALITKGALAVTAPVAMPYTSFTGHLECHDVHALPAISRVDHRTPVEISYIGHCVSSNVVITQHVLGATIKITEATATSSGITSETVASHVALGHTTNATLSVANGLQSDIPVEIEDNVTSKILYSHSESATVTGATLSISYP